VVKSTAFPTSPLNEFNDVTRSSLVPGIPLLIVDISPISSCTSLTASIRFVDTILITSPALAPVFNSMSTPCVLGALAWVNMSAESILFAGSVWGIPKFCDVENVPVDDLNLNTSESA